VEAVQAGPASDSGNVRYGPDTAPLAVEAGQIIFGEPDVRFGELIELLLESIGRLRRP
jgi:hypothetical protein